MTSVVTRTVGQELMIKQAQEHDLHELTLDEAELVAGGMSNVSAFLGGMGFAAGLMLVGLMLV